MVAHGSNSHANGKLPINNPFQFYFGGLEALGQAYDPFVKGIARTQLEMFGFFNRRAQAYMQMPTRVAQCRTPQDLTNLQTQFWRSAYEDYSQSVGRVTSALAACAPNLAALSQEALSARDYIAFPDTDTDTNTKDTGRGARERKAA